MKRRTQCKEAEINAKLPFVRDLVKNGHRAMRSGQSDLALAYYSAAQEQVPLLFSIGFKAAQRRTYIMAHVRPGWLPN